MIRYAPKRCTAWPRHQRWIQLIFSNACIKNCAGLNKCPDLMNTRGTLGLQYTKAQEETKSYAFLVDGICTDARAGFQDMDSPSFVNGILYWCHQAVTKTRQALPKICQQSDSRELEIKYHLTLIFGNSITLAIPNYSKNIRKSYFSLGEKMLVDRQQNADRILILLLSEENWRDMMQ